MDDQLSSKINSGLKKLHYFTLRKLAPYTFRAVSMWNGIIEHLQEIEHFSGKERESGFPLNQKGIKGSALVKHLFAFLESNSLCKQPVTKLNVEKLCQVLLDEEVLHCLDKKASNFKEYRNKWYTTAQLNPLDDEYVVIKLKKTIALEKLLKYLDIPVIQTLIDLLSIENCSNNTHETSKGELLAEHVHSDCKQQPIKKEYHNWSLSFLSKKALELYHMCIININVASHVTSISHSDTLKKQGKHKSSPPPTFVSKNNLLHAYHRLHHLLSDKVLSIGWNPLEEIFIAVSRLLLNGKEDHSSKCLSLGFYLLTSFHYELSKNLVFFLFCLIKINNVKLPAQRILCDMSSLLFSTQNLTPFDKWNLLEFISSNVEDIFKLPSDVELESDRRIKLGITSSDVNSWTFCARVSSEEYISITSESTEKALKELFIAIKEDETLSFTEKKNKLKAFRKVHPMIFL